jgi:hypothetical protein
MKAFKIMTYEERKEFMANALRFKSEYTVSWYLTLRKNSKNILTGIFGWSRTIQGIDYWKEISKRIQNELI